MAAKVSRDYYALVWRLPLIIWQVVFFVVPLGFMFVMSFWLVKNYRMGQLEENSHLGYFLEILRANIWAG
jgi:spermidine/putrescine transport system permease protein